MAQNKNHEKIMRQILISVTFREFNGDVNDKIQRVFLEGIRNQTYKNYKLIVTNFREKLVKKTLEESGLPFEFHQSKQEGCWHSFTEVIANTLSYLEKGKHIILWTNADNIFEPNFFEEIIKNFEPNSGGTSYPHLTYFSLEDFKKGYSVDTYHGNPIKSFYQLDPTLFVPDAIYIDGDVILGPKNQKIFLEHEIIGNYPGVAQTLMFAFFVPKLKNLIYKSKIANIQNVKIPNYNQPVRSKKLEDLEKEEKILNERVKKLGPERNRNTLTIMRFCKAKRIAERYWKPIFLTHYITNDKFLQHREYRIVGNFYQKTAYNIYLYFHAIRFSILRALNKFYNFFGIKKKKSYYFKRFYPYK